MKKRLLYLFMLISSVSLFMSCSDDDDVKYPVDSELAGAYKGTMDVYYVGVSTPIASDMVQKVYISKASDTAVKLELRNFTITVAGTELLIGDITVDNCALTKSGDAYKFSGNQTLSLVVGSCNTSVSGTVGKNAVDMVIDVDVEGGMKVKVNYKGTKLSGSENTEAKITDFTIDDEVITVAPVIDEAKSTITFKVNDEATEEELKALVPVIAISEKATVTPASGVAQDFSGGKSVVYTVVAEDGTMKKYSVFISGTNKVVVYDFEDWTVDESQSTPEYQYPIAVGGWASCNQAVVFIKGFGLLAKPNPITYNGPFPINKTEEAHGGNYAAELVSIDTTGSDNMLGQKVPKVTAGSIFLGTFVATNALADPMTTTLFGIEYSEKPLLVKGFFKYTPGTEFYNSNGVLEPDTKDECALSAVLYEVEDVKETLDGNNIYTSEKIVASSVYTNTGTSEYTPFELKLEYKKDKEYDPNKKYKFAVIFSASKDGAAYNAAVGSRLLIDDVTIVNE